MSASPTFGLVRIGDMDLAILAELIEEVVLGPLDLTPFPQAPRHVLGAFARRGAAVPVIDVAAVIKPAARNAAAPVDFAIVIRHPAGRFALQADATLGVVRATAEQLSALTPDTSPIMAESAPALFTRLYTPPNGGRVAVVLELDAVLAVEGLRSAVAGDANSRSSAESADSKANQANTCQTCAHVLFHAGGGFFALPAEAVRSVERRSGALASALSHPVLRGFHRFRDAELPVVDLPALLGLPARADGAESSHFVVVAHGGRAVALAIDNLVALDLFSSKEVQALPEDGFEHPEYFAGCRVTPSGAVALVLDPPALLAGAQLVDTAELFATGTDDQSADAALVAPGHYLVYRAGGGSLASLLLELEAVVTLPVDFTDLRGRGGALVGLSSRFGTSFQVLDLGALLGRPTPSAGPGFPVLIARTARGLIGYLVERIDFIQAAVPRTLHHASGRAQGHVPAFREHIRARSDGRDLAACVLPLSSPDFAPIEKISA